MKYGKARTGGWHIVYLDGPMCSTFGSTSGRVKAFDLVDVRETNDPEVIENVCGNCASALRKKGIAARRARAKPKRPKRDVYIPKNKFKE